jgi:3-oxoacyl-[acyl-carrier protein] reductase
MMARLSKKVALVTGGSRGIGAAIVRRLAEEKADVALTYRKAERAAQSVLGQVKQAGARGLAFAADNADPTALRAAVDRTVAELGGLDVLVSNAGILLFKPFDQFSIDEFDRMIAVDLRAAFVLTQAALPHMKNGGRIIIIGSNIGQYAALPMTSLYAMAKAGLVGLAKGMARDLGPQGITVNVVQPGPIETEANPSDGPYSDKLKALMVTPHYGKGADVAALVAYLASEESRFATGGVFTIDHGFTA